MLARDDLSSVFSVLRHQSPDGCKFGNKPARRHTRISQSQVATVDYLSRADRGSILVDYLGVSERQLVKTIERMIAEGKYELAAAALGWTKDRFVGSKSLNEVERLAYLKLMEKYQEFNPFKFIIYAGQIGVETPQMESKQQMQSK